MNDERRQKNVGKILKHLMKTSQNKEEIFTNLMSSCKNHRLSGDDCVRITLLFIAFTNSESDAVKSMMHESCKRSNKCPYPCDKTTFLGLRLTCGYKTSNVVIRLFKEWGRLLTIKSLVIVVTSGILSLAHETFIECFDTIKYANIFGTPALGLEDAIRTESLTGTGNTDEILVRALIGPIMEEIIHRGSIKPIINQALKKLGVKDPRSISTILSAIIFAISHLESSNESQLRKIAPYISVEDMQKFMFDVKTENFKKFFSTLASGIIYCTMQEEYGIQASAAVHVLNNSFTLLPQQIVHMIRRHQMT